MRRLLSNLILSGAILLGSVVALSPIVANMNSDVSYTNGRTLTFRVSHKDEGNERDFYDPENDNICAPLTEQDGYDPIKEVADTFRTRLETWGISEAQVNAVGYDTITVTLKAEIDTAEEYTRLEKYLTFSGGNLSLSASYIVSTGGSESSSYPDEGLDELLDGSTGRIEYIETSNSTNVPVVVMKISETGNHRQNFLDLIEYCNANTVADDEETTDKDETQNCNIVLWGNRHDGDVPNEGSVNISDDNIASRIIFSQPTTANNAVWYAENDREEDKMEFPYLQLVPNSASTNDAGAMYREARYLLNMVNAEELKYQIDFLYEEEANATVENLIALDWNRSLSWSKTLIATIVCMVVAMLILALFERLFAVPMSAVTAGTLILTLLFFFLFRAEFNIAALVGLAIIGALSLFGQLYYNSRLRDELYKGRTLRKANQEAAKKAIWPTVDASVVSIIIGLFLYLLAGDMVAKMGVVLVIGGFVSVLMNLILYRVLVWMLASDNGLQSSFPKMLAVKKDKLPDLLKEEKQTYFGALAERDFTKVKKPVSIATAVLILAGIGTMIGFGVANGTVYNDASLSENRSVLYLEARTNAKANGAEFENDTVIPSLDIIYQSYTYEADGKTIADTQSNAQAKKSLLRNIAYNGKSFADLYGSEDAIFAAMKMSDRPLRVYDTTGNVGVDMTNTLVYDWYYFTVDLPQYFSDQGYQDEVFTITNQDGSTATYNDVNVAIGDLIEEYLNVDSNTVVYSVKNIEAEEGLPSLGGVALGVGIGIAVASVYLMLRYRLSRGIAAGLISLSASYIALSFFVFTRIPVAPVVAIGSAGVALISFLVSLFLLGKEKDLVKESREKEKNGYEFRLECLKKANSYGAAEAVLFALLAAYIAIIYFGFGPSAFNAPYLNILLGSFLAIILSLVLLAPISGLLAKLFSKIQIKLPKRKKRTGHLQEKKSRSAEPEEAIFIGIND